MRRSATLDAAYAPFINIDPAYLKLLQSLYEVLAEGKAINYAKLIQQTVSLIGTTSTFGPESRTTARGSIRLMSKRHKLLEQMRNNPRDWRIDSLISVAESLGIEVRNDGGSHHVFSYPGIVDNLCVPAHRPIKPIYIKRFMALVEEVLEMNDARKSH